MLARWSRTVTLLCAVAFVVLLVIGFILTWNTPDVTDSPVKVLDYYRAHSSKIGAGSYLIALSIFFGLFWFVALRAYLRESPAAERLATAFLVGAIVFAVSGALVGGTGFALSDSPSHLTPAAAQALNTLYSDIEAPAFLVGLALMWMASGLAIERSRLLPRWLGWIGIVLGVVSLTPIGWVTVFVYLGWTLVVSVLVYLRRAPESVATPA